MDSHTDSMMTDAPTNFNERIGTPTSNLSVLWSENNTVYDPPVISTTQLLGTEMPNARIKPSIDALITSATLEADAIINPQYQFNPPTPPLSPLPILPLLPPVEPLNLRHYRIPRINPIPPVSSYTNPLIRQLETRLPELIHKLPTTGDFGYPQMAPPGLLNSAFAKNAQPSPDMVPVDDPIVSIRELSATISRYPTIKHPLINRPNWTTLRLYDARTHRYRIYHLGQIATFIATDHAVRAERFDPRMVPDGFDFFAFAFNFFSEDIKFAYYDWVTHTVKIEGRSPNLEDFEIDPALAGYSRSKRQRLIDQDTFDKRPLNVKRKSRRAPTYKPRPYTISVGA